MTKEEILAMEAGRELDALVAEKIMNHPMPDFIPEHALDLYLAGTPLHYDSWSCVCCYDEGDTPKWVPDPYSRDQGAAWQVWLAITRDDPYRWAIYPNPEKSGEIIIEHYSYYGGQECGEGELSVVGLAPEAICKAALLTTFEGGKNGR